VGCVFVFVFGDFGEIGEIGDFGDFGDFGDLCRLGEMQNAVKWVENCG